MLNSSRVKLKVVSFQTLSKLIKVHRESFLQLLGQIIEILFSSLIFSGIPQPGKKILSPSRLL